MPIPRLKRYRKIQLPEWFVLESPSGDQDGPYQGSTFGRNENGEYVSTAIGRPVFLRVVGSVSRLDGSLELTLETDRLASDDRTRYHRTVVPVPEPHPL